MGYDPKRSDWVNLAGVEPSEASGLDPVFSVRPVIEMYKRILGEEHASLTEIFSVSWPPEFSAVTLMYEDPLVLRLFHDMDFWVLNGHIVSRIWFSHRDMHDWLDRRRIAPSYPPAARVKPHITKFLSREPHWQSELDKDPGPEQLASILIEHINDHRAFRLWCIFREALVRIGKRERLPSWLTDDLDRLAKQATVELDPSGKSRIAGGPSEWAIDVLRRASDPAGSSVPIKLCQRCNQPFEQCGPGRPSLRCPDCRPIGRLEDDRECKRAARRLRNAGRDSGSA